MVNSTAGGLHSGFQYCQYAALRPSGSIMGPSGDTTFGPWAAYFPVPLCQGCDNVTMSSFICHFLLPRHDSRRRLLPPRCPLLRSSRAPWPPPTPAAGRSRASPSQLTQSRCRRGQKRAAERHYAHAQQQSVPPQLTPWRRRRRLID